MAILALLALGYGLGKGFGVVEKATPASSTTPSPTPTPPPAQPVEKKEGASNKNDARAEKEHTVAIAGNDNTVKQWNGPLLVVELKGKTTPQTPHTAMWWDSPTGRAIYLTDFCGPFVLQPGEDCTFNYPVGGPGNELTTDVEVDCGGVFSAFNIGTEESHKWVQTKDFTRGTNIVQSLRLRNISSGELEVKFRVSRKY